MEIKKISRENFNAYGAILDGYDLKPLLEKMKDTPAPTEEVIYIPSDEQLEMFPIKRELENRGYGGLAIQIGYCNGWNNRLNAVEYHRNSEIDIAVDDIILLVGKQQDIKEDKTYDTSLIEAFYVPAGTAVELYATTLHYAPIGAGENTFRCVIVLPKDTNTELDFKLETGADAPRENKLLFARNKWLIAHEDAKIDGAFCGLIGENITLY